MPRKPPSCKRCGKPMRRLKSVFACESCGEFRFVDEEPNAGA